MTHPTRAEIDQQELKAAIEGLAESTADDGQEVTIYRNPLDVAREEWRKQVYGKIPTELLPEVKANWLKLDTLRALPPLYSVDSSDEESFEDVIKSWSQNSNLTRISGPESQGDK